MKYTTERDTIIYDMWANQNMSFKTISCQPIQAFLSIKRIRNIIYCGPGKLKSRCGYEKEVYRDFRLKFLELQSINAAIWFIYENQSYKVLYCENSIRRIINHQLKKKKQPALAHLPSPLSPQSPEN